MEVVERFESGRDPCRGGSRDRSVNDLGRRPEDGRCEITAAKALVWFSRRTADANERRTHLDDIAGGDSPPVLDALSVDVRAVAGPQIFDRPAVAVGDDPGVVARH